MLKVCWIGRLNTADYRIGADDWLVLIAHE